MASIIGTSDDDTLDGTADDDFIDGRGGADILSGAAGNDELRGRGGDDSMAGGIGDDVYYVTEAGDQVIEAAGEGSDKVNTAVSYTLAAGQEIEQLQVRGSAGLTLTGNEFDNILTGGDGADVLDGGSGRDRVNGGAGNDTITSTGQKANIKAGDGDDTIRLDGTTSSTGSVDGGAGDDTVRSTNIGTFTFQNVETLDTYYGFLTGSVAQIASFDSFTADLAAPDTQISFSLRGTGGTLDFTTGISGQNSVEIRDAGLTSAIQITGSVNDDRMFGSTFDDTLSGGNGKDTLLGGDGSDTLAGGDGKDQLNGGTGNDQLTGGGGADFFIFNTSFEAGTNIDLVADFTSGNDLFQLDQTFYFLGLTVGPLAAAQFATGSATGSGPQIVYVQASGALFYDSNGANAGGASQFATVAGAPALTAADFRVV